MNHDMLIGFTEEQRRQLEQERYADQVESKPKPTPTAFGVEFKRIREEKGLTTLAVSKRAMCDRSYISKLETGARDVPMASMTGSLIHALDATSEERMRLMLAAGQVPYSAQVFIDLWVRLPSLIQDQFTAMARAFVNEQKRD